MHTLGLKPWPCVRQVEKEKKREGIESALLEQEEREAAQKAAKVRAGARGIMMEGGRVLCRARKLGRSYLATPLGNEDVP